MPTRVTIALDRYDRHFPFFLKQLSVPSDIELVPLEVGMVPPRRHGINRHRRMLHDKEFAAAETSLASYIIAKSYGAPFTAIPIFPRRLFSQNHIFVADQSPARQPGDLIGKRILVWAFQVTMSVLAKADMQRYYGADWKSMQWLTLQPEEVPIEGISVKRVPAGCDPLQMLREKQAEAFIYPHPPAEAISGKHGIRRLFADPANACRDYFKQTRYYPIMHLIVLQQSVVEANSDLPIVLMKLWEEAKAISEDYYHDPGFGLVALNRLGFEQQCKDWGADIWPSGVRANRSNLERFIDDMVDQGLIARPLALDELFHASTLAT